MKVYRSYRGVPETARGAVVAIGNFDGVHRGHKALIKAARERAEPLGAELGLITFEPHPLLRLRPTLAPKRLTPFRTKAIILAKSGVRRLFALAFTKTMQKKSPDDFVLDVLVEGLGVQHVAVGYDFRFGHKASGDVDLLIALGRQHGFGVTRVEPVTWQSDLCSSSKIRTLIGEGDVASAAQLLGHPFVIEGHVVGGDRRGRELGFPTANIRPSSPHRSNGQILWPPAGVYAVHVAWRDEDRLVNADGVASIGLRPTFDDQQGLLLEIHLFDVAADLYGKRLCCQFVERLRPEAAFKDIESLKVQMAKDCVDARIALAKMPWDAYINDAMASDNGT